jgi:hypothetical protein
MTMFLTSIESLQKGEEVVEWHVSPKFRYWTLRTVANRRPVPLAAIAGSVAAAAYLDAKYLIRHDLAAGSVSSNTAVALAFITERTKQGRLLIYRKLTSLHLPSPPV